MKERIELIGMCLILYAFFILIVNTFLYYVVNIKWFKPKKYKGRLSPIYRLEYYHWDEYYHICKYELGWNKDVDKFWWYYLIPFSSMFSFYNYIKHCETYGQYSESQLAEDLNIKLVWEDSYREHVRKTKMWELENQDKTSRLDIINKTFNENYI